MQPPELHRARSAQSAQTQYSFEDDDDDVDFVDEAKVTEVGGRLQHIFQSLTSLEAERQRLMREAVECTGLNEDEAVLLLRGCAWDVAVFNEAFFEDAEALRSRIGVAEEDCQMSSAEGAPLCSICFSEPGESLMPCQAPELFCRDCWRQYLEQAVQEGRGCLDLRCPAVACKELVRPSLFASLLSAPLLERYQRFLTGSLVDDSRGKLRWCPGRNCSAAAGEPLGGLQEVTCPCGTSWCFRCGNDVHLPVTCETVRRWEEKNRDEGCDVVWIKANTKLCPKCQNPIEKNGGCMHMTCRKPGGCGHEFCWICMKSWRDHRQCNAVEEDATGKAATKHELLRYAHYFERYLAHHKAEQFASKGLRQASEAVAELFTKSLGVTVSDVAFMGNACNQIRNSRRFLKWTYAHGYFMKCDDAKKRLFEFHQAQLEGTLERLSDIMENTPWGSYMGDEVISFQPFYDLRTRVISLTSVVCDFFSKLQEAMQQENFAGA